MTQAQRIKTTLSKEFTMKRRNLLKGIIGGVMGVTAAPLLAKANSVPDAEVSLPVFSKTTATANLTLLSVIGDCPVQREKTVKDISENIFRTLPSQLVVVCETFNEFEDRFLKAFYASVDNSPLLFSNSLLGENAARQHLNREALLALLRYRGITTPTVIIVSDSLRDTFSIDRKSNFKQYPSMREAPEIFNFLCDGAVLANKETPTKILRSNSKTAPVFEALNWA